MRKKPPPQYFSAAAAFLEDKCLDFTDSSLGIFCKSSVQILRGFEKRRRIDVKTAQDFSDYIIDNQLVKKIPPQYFHPFYKKTALINTFIPIHHS